MALAGRMRKCRNMSSHRIPILSAAFSLASRLDSARTTQRRLCGAQPGHNDVPCRRDAHSKRTVFSATVPTLAIHVALDQLRHHLCGAATRLVDTLSLPR
jgi:hypothetical protein